MDFFTQEILEVLPRGWDWQIRHLDSIFTLFGVLWFVLSVLHLQWFALEGFFRQFLEGLFCHFWGFEFHKGVTWHQSKFS